MEDLRLTLGVLGGMGPAATLAFLARLQAFTPTESSQDHLRVLADINPQVPDPQGPDAGPVLAEMAGALAGAGAEVLVIVSSTAHAHADLIQRACGLPLIDMIETGARAARRTGAHQVGVLGPRGALRLYREYLAARGMELVALPPARQAAFMATLDKIAAGNTGREVRRQMQAYGAELVSAGAQAVVAGCAEAPLVLAPGDLRVEIIDPGELLARRCVEVCLGLEPIPPMPM